MAGLPDHLGWGSAAQTAVLRAAALRRAAQRGRTPEPARRSVLPWPPEGPPAREVAPPSKTGTIPLAPSLGLAVLRHKEAAVFRLWLLLRYADTQGQGALPLARAQTLFTEAGSPLRFCGRRQLRNLLAAGEGRFWQTNSDHVWLRSAARVAATLGVRRFRGQEVAFPIQALVGGIAAVRANLYAAFHSGRKGAPIARQTLARKSGVAERTQRRYDRLCGLEKQANFARGPLLGSAQAQELAWRFGPAAFTWRAKGAGQESKKRRFLAWQLPNSYHGPHAQLGRGRQKRQNKALAGLLNIGTAGNDQGQVDALREGDTLSQSYFAHARAAAKVYGRSQKPIYWPDTGRGVWHSLLPSSSSSPHLISKEYA